MEKHGDSRTAKTILATRTGLEARYPGKGTKEKTRPCAKWIAQRRAIVAASNSDGNSKLQKKHYLH